MTVHIFYVLETDMDCHKWKTFYERKINGRWKMKEQQTKVKNDHFSLLRSFFLEHNDVLQTA